MISVVLPRTQRNIMLHVGRLQHYPTVSGLHLVTLPHFQDVHCWTYFPRFRYRVNMLLSPVSDSSHLFQPTFLRSLYKLQNYVVQGRSKAIVLVTDVNHTTVPFVVSSCAY
jgi:hypothetical protein